MKRWVYILIVVVAVDLSGAGFLCAGRMAEFPACCPHQNLESEEQGLSAATPTCCTTSAPDNGAAKTRWERAGRHQDRGETALEAQSVRAAEAVQGFSSVPHKSFLNKLSCSDPPLKFICVLRI